MLPTIRPELKLPDEAVKGADTKQNQGCVDIEAIDLKPADSLSTKQQSEIFKPYLGTCIRFNDINKILRDITAIFYGRGEITSRAVLDEQNLQDKQLEITIIEGRIEALEAGSDSEITPLMLNRVMPTTEGDILNLRDLEQGLDQLNRLSSNNAALSLNPGNIPGGTNIIVNNQPSSRIHGSLGINNSGQRATGERQRKATLTIDSPLGMADYLAISMQGDNVGEKFKKSASYSVFYELPLGYWTLGLDLSYFEYTSGLDLAGQIIKSNGKSRTQSVHVKRVLRRDRSSTTTISAKLLRKDVLNFLADTKLISGSRTLVILESGLIHDQHFKEGRLRSALTYYRGVDFLDATIDPSGLTDEQPKAQFDKWGLRVDYSRPFQLFSLPSAWDINFEGQYSEDKLYGSEQFSIGGQYTVRGYKDSSIYGDSGAFISTSIRSELAQNIPLIGSLQAEIGVDYGLVDVEDFGFKGTDKLRGWRVGLKTQQGLFDISITYAQAVNPINYINHNDSEWYVSVGLSI